MLLRNLNKISWPPIYLRVNTSNPRLQELDIDFAKICISPKPSGAPVGKVPLQVLKELEHQARQNLSTINFTASLARTASYCNTGMEKCLHSAKAIFKRVKNQIQKDAERAARHGYENACDYFELMNKRILIQQGVIAGLSKSVAHILQRELYTMGNTGLLRREAEMTLLQPHLGDSRRQELRNLPFWPTSLFKSQLVKDGEDFLLKKGTPKDSQGFGPYQNKPFRGTHHNKKRGSYRKCPYGGNSSQRSNQSFSSGGGNRTSKAPGVVFETPPPNDSFQSTSRRSPPFFQKKLAHKQMLRQRVKHYHQWLRSSIHLKTKFSQSPSDSHKALQKELALATCIQSLLSKNAIERVENVKSLGFLQSPVSCTQASPKVEASNRPKQAQHLSTCRKVQNGNTRVHQGLSDSRGMGVVDRPSRPIPSHPHPPKLKEVSKVLPQVASVSVHFPFLQTSHGPSGLYNDCKRGEADGPAKGTQTSPVPGQLADQGLVSGRSPSKHLDSVGPNSVARVDNKSGEVRTKANSGVFLRGLRIPSRFSPCKTHSREMAQTSGFDPTTQVNDCKMFDVANWVACVNGENGPGGTPSYEALSVSPQGALEISSVVGHPPSMDRNHFSTPRLVAKSHKCDERCRPSSQRPQYPTLYRCLK